MGRFLAGGLAALLLVAAGLFWMRSGAQQTILPGPGAAAARAEQASLSFGRPPVASEATREQRRFRHYDHDRDGKVSRDEYLAARHRAFDKLDTNHDGKLAFEEYAIKTSDRFAKADLDRSATLDAEEFATTRVQRRPARPDCPPARATASGGGGDDD